MMMVVLVVMLVEEDWASLKSWSETFKRKKKSGYGLSTSKFPHDFSIQNPRLWKFLEKNSVLPRFNINHNALHWSH